MTSRNNHKPKHHKSILYRISHFFPVQLVMMHIKRNHILLVFWLVLFAYVTDMMGSNYGISHLFLSPEYLGEVNFLSYMLLGIALGGFIMAFNIYSYIMFAREFPFLATLSRPFVKFCYNNHLIPLFFVFTLIGRSFKFQITEQLLPFYEAIVNISGLGLGILSFIFVSTLYFIRFNKNVYKISGKDAHYFDSLLGDSAKEAALIKKVKWYQRFSKREEWKVHSYMGGILKIQMARSSKHYDKELLRKVFAQNHINAAIFEMFLVVSFIILGLFREVDWINIPAAASIFLLFTLFLLLFSAFYSWFRGWTLSILIVLLLIINYASNNYEAFRFKNYAYGIDYNVTASYRMNDLRNVCGDNKTYQESIEHTLETLENWKLENTVIEDGEVGKPKLVLLNVSGGGLRSALWTMHSLSYVDSITGGKLLDRTHMITGASGGIIGASYLRELYLQKKENPGFDMYDQQYRDNICKDLLNPMAFSIATSDFFIRYQTIHDGNYTYTKDRGYFFEQKMVENLNAFHDKRLHDYYLPEKEAKIPTIIYSPTIVNDGRRLLISSQPISYLAYQDSSLYTSTYHSLENIEFRQLFCDNNAVNLKITSAIRMSATFPYVLPMVSLPTDPPVEVMDAGLRDNYGTKLSVDFLTTFKDWIAENTSGVLVVQVRDQQKYFEVENPNSGSIMQRLFTPFSTIYGNILKTHDYNNDQMLQMAQDLMGDQLDVVTFYLYQDVEDEITMSFHLTGLDKKRILNAMNNSDNQKSLNRLMEVLNEE